MLSKVPRREIDDDADDRRLFDGTAHRGIDGAGEGVDQPEASRITTVEPTKNHGRFLNVSQPKRMADPVENSMAARYHAAALGEVDGEDFHNS